MKTFSDFLNSEVGKRGLGTLADQIKVDSAVLSKYRSGQGAMMLYAIDNLFELAGVVIISKEDLRKLEDTLETMSDLWKEERRKK